MAAALLSDRLCALRNRINARTISEEYKRGFLCSPSRYFSHGLLHATPVVCTLDPITSPCVAEPGAVLALNLVEALSRRERSGVIVGNALQTVHPGHGWHPSGFQNGADGTGERNPGVSNK